MKAENAIEVHNLTKAFKVYLDKGHTIKEKILFRRRRSYEVRRVLNGISFEVKKGEAIGLIGHNGCGKSTTLKLLTKIMYPDSGTIQMKGRVTSLIELGAGFHPDMSGRENIYINASIFGLNKREIDRRMEQIIGFSELDEYIDNPVRTYSSGMYMRLAFSVAINVDADILLIDEILAVGDVNFQTKCFERLKEIKKKGTTIVIVSHSFSQIEQICDKSIWINEGKVVDEGIPKYVHEKYLSAMEEKRLKKKENIKASVSQTIENDTKKDSELPAFCSPLSIRVGNREAEFTDVKLMTADYAQKTVYKTGEPFFVQMDYHCNQQGMKVNFGIGIFRDDGVHVYGTNTLIEHNVLVQMKQKGSVQVMIKNNCLLPGTYMLDVAMHSDDGVRYDDIRNVTPFVVTANKKDIGVCRLDNYWIVDGEQLAKRGCGDVV